MTGQVMLGSLKISKAALLTIAVTIVAMVALTLTVQKTKLGKAMRAVSEDMGAAQLMGISLNKTISFTFAIGSALAGIGSVLYLCAYQQASPTMGSMLGPEGVRCGGAWRHRLDPRCNDRRLCDWSARGAGLRGEPLRLEGRRRICNFNCGATMVKPTGILGRPQVEKV